MIQFDKIAIEGFCPFVGKHEVVLDAPSLLVLGANTGLSAAASNGVGKSTIFKALTWCLYGETSDNMSGNDVINNRSKSAKVIVQISDGEKRIVVERKRSKGQTTASFHVTKRKNTLDKCIGHKQVAEAVEICLGMNWQTFRNTTMYCQNDLKRFADSTTTDSERKAILKKILNLDVITDCAAIARKRSSEALSATAVALGEKLKIEEALLLTNEDLERHQKQEKGWTQHHNDRLVELSGEIQSVEKEIKNRKSQTKQRNKGEKIKQQAEEGIAEASSKEEDLRKWLVEYQQLWANSEKQEASASAKVNSVEGKLMTLSGDFCPVCRNDLKGKKASRYKAELEKELDDCEKQVQKYKDEAVDYKGRIEKTQSEVGEAVSTIADLRVIRDKSVDAVNRLQVEILRQDGFEAEKAKLQERIAEVEKENNPYHESVEKLMKRKRTQSREKSMVSKKIAGLEIKERQLAFWVKAFSNEGLVNWAIHQVLPDLEAATNQYLDVLSDGAIVLALDTKSNLKSGKATDKLAIVLDIEGNGNVKPSGGQAKRISLAVSLALMSLVRARTGASVANLFLDEPDVGLDDAGKERFYGPLLGVLKEQYGRIAVITHDPNVHGAFDDTVFVKREDGASSIQ